MKIVIGFIFGKTTTVGISINAWRDGAKHDNESESLISSLWATEILEGTYSQLSFCKY